jgi:hypothetical protein
VLPKKQSRLVTNEYLEKVSHALMLAR